MSGMIWSTSFTASEPPGVKQFCTSMTRRTSRAVGHLAARANEEGRRQRCDPPAVGGLRIGIEEDREGELQAPHVRLEETLRRAAIHRDADHDQATIAVASPQRLQRGHLEGTGLAPRRPEVQDDELVPMVDQRGLAAVEGGEREAEGLLALLQLDDAGLLERVEDGRGRAVVAGVLARAAHREDPDDRAQDDDGEAGADQRLPPGRAEK